MIKHTYDTDLDVHRNLFIAGRAEQLCYLDKLHA